jgi:signal transduction histidine kinase
MKLLTITTFAIFAVIQLGTFFSLLTYVRSDSENISNRYWIYSMLFNAISLLIAAFGLLHTTPGVYYLKGYIVITYPLLVSRIFLSFFYHSLRVKIERSYAKQIFIYGALGSFLYFILIPDHMPYRYSVLPMLLVNLAMFIWQLYELNILRTKAEFKPLFVCFFITIAEIAVMLAGLYSLFLLEDRTNQYFYESSIYVIGLKLSQELLITLSYIFIGGYLLKKIATDNARFASDNADIHRLLDEKNVLINSLAQANKAAVAGAMSASIAHELNQPLCVIQNNAEFMEELLGRDEKSKQLPELLSAILVSTKRASGIIESLRKVFTLDKIDFQTTSLDSLIKSLDPIYRSKLDEFGVVITYDLDASREVPINPGNFQQIILNLINNSIEAFSGNKNENKRIKVKTTQTDTSTSLYVIDNGVGIPKNLEPFLFDLLKSSKPNGMGLGLWLSNYIAERHGGSLNYEVLKTGEICFSVIIPN